MCVQKTISYLPKSNPENMASEPKRLKKGKFSAS